MSEDWINCYFEFSVSSLWLDLVGLRRHPVTCSEKGFLPVPYTSKLGIDAMSCLCMFSFFLLSLATSLCLLYTHEGDLNSFLSQIITININTTWT